ncbi:MAG: prenyltransferase/squalene oxidase repeat-containing protein [Pirellulales bacterium]
MNTRTSIPAAMLLAILGTLAISLQSRAVDAPPPGQNPAAPRAVQPKPLSITVEQGLKYLLAQQHESGGWGQGGGWRQQVGAGGNASGRVEGDNVNDPSDLGNTCIATLALIRAGSTPQGGPHANHVAQAVKLICDYVERSDNDSLYVTDVRDTQLQSKIGRYVDTFLAGLVLSELKGKMPADGSDQRLIAALDKTVRKIEKNQREDGNFAGNTGWASVLSQAVCSKFINRAAQAQVVVKSEVLNRDFYSSVAALDRGAAPAASVSGRVAAAPVAGAAPAASAAASAPAEGAPTDAGVSLYFIASNASRIADQNNTAVVQAEKAKEVLKSSSATAEEKDRARSELGRIDEVRGAQQSAVRDITRQLDDKGFVAGFGNNGGEEFLSYMNISELLVVQGGPEWEKWDQSMAANLKRVQNQDGSWSGQHCITGRTFCTAAALLTLMADRAPVPLAAKINNQQAR